MSGAHSLLVSLKHKSGNLKHWTRKTSGPNGQLHKSPTISDTEELGGCGRLLFQLCSGRGTAERLFEGDALAIEATVGAQLEAPVEGVRMRMASTSLGGHLAVR